MRDLPGFVESRRQIVCQKPGLRIHWIGYAVAAHLAGQHGLALTVCIYIILYMSCTMGT